MSERVLLCGAWDEGAGYPRTRSLRMGLEAAGVEVSECRVPGMGRKKQGLIKQPWMWPAVWWQGREQRRKLLETLASSVEEHRPHAVVVPYPGHGVIRAVKEAVSVPVAFDMFLSAYDTVIEDRRLAKPGSMLARYLQGIDTHACACADLVVLDTPENASYVQELTELPAERFTWLPVHDPDAAIETPAWQPPKEGELLQLLFFGTGVPLHGLATLVAAVAKVPAIKLTIVGGTAEDRRFAKEALGARVQIGPEFVDRERLQELMAASHLVAGVFGASNKTQRVVPFKVVHALAAGRPVITADTPAIARWLDGSGVVFTAPANDVDNLARALGELADDPGVLQAAAAKACAAYERHFGTPRLAERWREVLQRINPIRFSADVECA